MAKAVSHFVAVVGAVLLIIVLVIEVNSSVVHTGQSASTEEVKK